jgi:hypothetical protein
MEPYQLLPLATYMLSCLRGSLIHLQHQLQLDLLLNFGLEQFSLLEQILASARTAPKVTGSH